VTTNHLSLDNAIEIYFESFDNDTIASQPSRSLSRLVRSARPYWILANVRGELARIDAITGRVHRSSENS
jgi:hypothetical protein